MKLKSMSDFALEYIEVPDKLEEGEFKQAYYDMCKYAQFLKRPLELSMFVPCDEKGNIIEKPEYFEEYFKDMDLTNWNDTEKQFIIKYLKAQERVLFKDAKILGEFKTCKVSFIKINANSIENDEFGFFYHDAKNEKSRVNTVEDIVNICSLELTDNAIKQWKLN